MNQCPPDNTIKRIPINRDRQRERPGMISKIPAADEGTEERAAKAQHLPVFLKQKILFQTVGI